MQRGRYLIDRGICNPGQRMTSAPLLVPAHTIRFSRRHRCRDGGRHCRGGRTFRLHGQHLADRADRASGVPDRIGRGSWIGERWLRHRRIVGSSASRCGVIRCGSGTLRPRGSPGTRDCWYGRGQLAAPAATLRHNLGRRGRRGRRHFVSGGGVCRNTSIFIVGYRWSVRHSGSTLPLRPLRTSSTARRAATRRRGERKDTWCSGRSNWRCCRCCVNARNGKARSWWCLVRREGAFGVGRPRLGVSSWHGERR